MAQGRGFLENMLTICGFLGYDAEYIIPFECIRRIGEDIILVEIKEDKCLKPCK